MSVANLLLPAMSGMTIALILAGCNTERVAQLTAQPEPSDSMLASTEVRPAAMSGSTYASEDSSFWYSRKGGEHLGVLTFNMEHRDKPEQLAALAQHLRSDLRDMPDFVLCQEVLFERPERKGHDNTAEVLADEIGYHARCTKRSSDKEGVAILSRYPFQHYAALELKSQTSRLLLGFNRVSVMGEFQVPAVGLVRVVNVHFTNWRFEERVRTNQLRETLQWIADREQYTHADVTILGGDFNMLPDGDERLVVTNHEDAGSLSFQDHNTSDPTRGPGGHPTARVDYVFVAAPQRDLKFLGEDRLFKNGLRDNDGDLFYLSDHVPVLHQYLVQESSANRGSVTVQATDPSGAATLLR